MSNDYVTKSFSESHVEVDILRVQGYSKLRAREIEMIKNIRLYLNAFVREEFSDEEIKEVFAPKHMNIELSPVSEFARSEWEKGGISMSIEYLSSNSFRSPKFTFDAKTEMVGDDGKRYHMRLRITEDSNDRGERKKTRSLSVTEIGSEEGNQMSVNTPGVIRGNDISVNTRGESLNDVVKQFAQSFRWLDAEGFDHCAVDEEFQLRLAHNFRQLLLFGYITQEYVHKK